MCHHIYPLAVIAMGYNPYTIDHLWLPKAERPTLELTAAFIHSNGQANAFKPVLTETVGAIEKRWA